MTQNIRKIAFAGMVAATLALAAAPAPAAAQATADPVEAQASPAPMATPGGDSADTGGGANMNGAMATPGQAAIDPAPVGDAGTRIVTNGPVPDTAANRARFGGPLSHGGRKTPPAGN